MKFFNILRKKEKKSVLNNGSVVYFTESGDPIFTGENYYNYSKESYLKNVYSRRCISLIANSIALVPWELHRFIDPKKSEIVINSPYLKLFKRPNPEKGFWFFLYETICYLHLWGEAYIQRISPISGANANIPKELYSLRPDRVDIIINSVTNQIKEYTYKVGSQKLIFPIDFITKQSNLLQLKLFNPIEDFHGASLTKTAARDIDTDNEAVNWNMRLLQNEARPGMIVMYDQTLTEDQRKKLKKQLQENYTNENRGKNLILEGKVKEAKPYGWNPKDMDFPEGSKATIRRLCAGYGVPPQLVGIPDSSTYANYKEAREAMWDETILPYIKYLIDEFNNWLFPNTDEYFLKPNYEGVPALSEKRNKLWDRAQSSDFITDNEKREMVGFESYEGGDVIFKPANLLPLDEIGAGQDDGKSDDDEEKTIQNLINQGYTEDEARNALDY